MRKIIVKVDKEKATELERVNFELNFVKDIVQRVIESHPSDLELINGDTLMSYNTRGAELQRKYAALANEMAKEGYTWQEILYYFFRDVTLETIG